MSSLQQRPHGLAFVAVVVLLDIVGLGLILPVLPTLLAELTGKATNATAVYGGWLAFTYAAMQFLCAPLLGALSDRYGRRPVLLFAIGALGVDYIMMGLAPTLAWLFVGRAVAGAAGASFTPAYAYVADISAPEKRAQAFGVVSAMFGLGFVAGPAIGGLLGAFGPRTPFFVAAALSLINFAYGLAILPESLPAERRRPFEWHRAHPLGTLRQLRKQREVRGVLVALFLWMLGHQVMPATWTFYTKFRFDWSEAEIGGSLALAGIVMALSQATLLRFLVPRLGERTTALLGISVAIAGYLGYATATAGWMMLAWTGVWLLGALVMPSTNALMSKRVDSSAQGELQGAVACLYSLSSIVGPPLLTFLFARFSAPDAALPLPGAAFVAAAVMSATCLVFYVVSTKAAPPSH